MASKTEKRQAQRHREEEKAAIERMKHLDQKSVNALINYGVMQILYINDAAYVYCNLLGDELKKIPYKSNAVKKVYGALMKRWDEHRQMLSCPEIDEYSMAELFGEMDGYISDFLDSFQDAIQGVLERENVPHAHWIANVETANTLCSYAVQIAKDFTESITRIDKRGSVLIHMSAKEPARVMQNMATLVQSIHVKKEIDLNTEPTVQSAFRKFNKSFIDPKNFIDAQTVADAENRAEGRMTIM